MVTSKGDVVANGVGSASTNGNRARPARPSPVLSMFDTLGEIAKFSGHALRELPIAIRLYPAEIVRQAGVMVLSSSIILWTFTFVIGLEAALIGSYMLQGLGAADYIGLFTALAGVRAVSAPVFGWIFAAKVGCGYAAELGTMRITEEIDALHVMGIRPRAYLVGTRLAASLIVVPFLWLVSTGLMMVGSYLMSRPLLETASPGGYSDVFWSFQTPADLMLALAWAVISCVVIVLVSCYFGYTAGGGPVGVGRNTARSMLINMVSVSVFTGICYQLFFGVVVEVPIAN